jgi:hypothetical protein
MVKLFILAEIVHVYVSFNEKLKQVTEPFFHIIKFRMKQFLILLVVISTNFTFINAQKIYTTSGGEILFQSSVIEQSDDENNSVPRFTAAFHLGEFVHVDFGNTIGIFSGIGLRNVGFITNNNDVKIKYRSYNIGIPLAVKLGSFRNNIYLFGGAEYEWMINFKQKTFRDGGKYKFSSWFSKRTPAFIPSAFAGMQFPGGLQLKFKYYLDDFLNNRFRGNDVYNDYTVFTRTQLWYVSLSYLIKNNDRKNKASVPFEVADLSR